MQNFNVDISSPGGPLVFYAMQADSLSRFFTLTITDNGEAWSPPSGALWSVRFGAPQMPSGWYDTITEVGGGTHPAIDVSGNVATVEIAEQALESPGKNTLCILVTNSSGYQIANWPITLQIQPVPGLTAPEATTYYNLLTAQVAQALQNAQNAASSATAAANSAELSESWAVGGTGSRAGEDTNNAEYWAQQSQKAANNRVASFNGRTGAVMPKEGDYTAADVGALALTGGTVSGTTVFQNGLYAYRKSTDGTPAKYLQIATITITGYVVDVPIELVVVKRDYTESAKLSIKFEISQTSNPDLQSFNFSGYGLSTSFAMVKTAPGVWAVYASVYSTFDSLCVTFVNTDWAYLQSRTTITLGGETVNTLPDGAVYATFHNPASALATSRKIGNASFNGTADITLAQIGALSASFFNDLSFTSRTVSGTSGSVSFSGTVWFLQIGKLVFLSASISSTETVPATSLIFVDAPFLPQPAASGPTSYMLAGGSVQKSLTAWINNKQIVFNPMDNIDANAAMFVSGWYMAD